ncbi:serine hydrolase domain-containing protein [Alloyangia pacifica]|uniref:serine hydrolase domain-containing protein n=1 Tax=Alloyangia pacifica TaxID=311180 RepID=UPI001CFD104D|nr:serine hydrolase domain-containing protein [Alloyangia pacifica]
MAPPLPIITCRLRGDTAEMLGGTGTEILPYWSFTKTVLAICALKLAEAGRLQLDVPRPGESFTLRQLLDHTAGLPDYFPLQTYRDAVAANEAPWPRDRLYAETMAQGPRFTPGAGWAYSNLGYMLVRDRIEEAAGQPFGAHVVQAITGPLGLRSIALATTRADFARVHWPAARGYHPGWVYHGCLTGSAPDAARLLQAVFSGALLAPASQAQMLQRRLLGGALEGRPWTDCGYSLGLMNGRTGAAGRAIGHSGGGPFCVNAVYHFPDAAPPVTVASFAPGPSEGIAEHAAVRAAL